jgi:hypothetical protein
MKDFIRYKLKQSLNEVTFEDHYYERSEDRVWGKKPAGPASINADAWAGNDVEDVRNLLAYDEVRHKLYTQHDVPITKKVKTILDKANDLADITFDTPKSVAITMWRSNVVYTGKDQKPPGGTLVAVIRNNSVMNIQWQPSKDVNVSGGKVTNTDYIISFEMLIGYVAETGNKTITTADLNILRDRIMGIEPKQEKEKEKEKIFIYDNSKYVLLNDDGDLVNKNNPNKIVKFDDLPKELQEKVLEALG